MRLSVAKMARAPATVQRDIIEEVRGLYVSPATARTYRLRYTKMKEMSKKMGFHDVSLEFFEWFVATAYSQAGGGTSTMAGYLAAIAYTHRRSGRFLDKEDKRTRTLPRFSLQWQESSAN